MKFLLELDDIESIRVYSSYEAKVDGEVFKTDPKLTFFLENPCGSELYEFDKYNVFDSDLIFKYEFKISRGDLHKSFELKCTSSFKKKIIDITKIA